MRTLAIVLILISLVILALSGGVSAEAVAGEWKFEGDARDSSGKEHHGIVYGATFVDGIKGKALSFDGVDDYVYVVDIGSLTQLTVELWAKSTGATADSWQRTISG